MDINTGVVDSCVEFLTNYYKEDLARIANKYPKERSALWVDLKDLYRYDQDLYRDAMNKPNLIIEHLEAAVSRVSLPIDIDLDGLTVYFTDQSEYLDRKRVSDLDKDDIGTLVAIKGQVGKVSERKPRLKIGAFECQRCGSITRTPQRFSEASEPTECQGCERSGPYELKSGESEWVDQRKLQLETPPEVPADSELIGYCIDELADPKGVNLQEKAGSRVTVIGKLEADESSLFGSGSNEPIADEYVVPYAFLWGDNLQEDVDVDQHRKSVEEAVSESEPIETFKRNIDPTLVITEEWDKALEMLACYLVGAPRIDPEDGGKTIRGDLHMLFVSDPGMNKSDIASRIADLSPKGLLKDAEGMSSSVALTAAATRDGFNDNSWSISPGALPKANNGHLILDEIDKGPNDLMEGIHSPLEGDQTLRVEKAGQDVTLATRCGLLALGNPVNGTFEKFEPIAEQVDLHDALMSRFDLICTMTDSAEEEVDGKIASGVLETVDESAKLDKGELDPEEAKNTTGELSDQEMKAWVKIARTEIYPLLTDEAKTRLEEFYVKTRQENDDEDKPAITARSLTASIRIAMAYARIELCDEVKKRHAERAVELSKAVISHNYDPDTGEFDPGRTNEQPSSQKQRFEAIMDACIDEAKTVSEIANETGISEHTVENHVDKLKEQGRLYEPESGKVITT